MLVRLRVFLVQTAAEEEEQIAGLSFMKKLNERIFHQTYVLQLNFTFQSKF